MCMRVLSCFFAVLWAGFGCHTSAVASIAFVLFARLRHGLACCHMSAVAFSRCAMCRFAEDILLVTIVGKSEKMFQTVM